MVGDIEPRGGARQYGQPVQAEVEVPQSLEIEILAHLCYQAYEGTVAGHHGCCGGGRVPGPAQR